MRVFIAGTGVPNFAADSVYRPLADSLDMDAVIGIPSWGIGHCAESARQVYLRFGFHHQVDLVGHSQGGLVAALLATLHPGWVRRVITLGAPLRGSPRSTFVLPVASFRCMTPGARILDQLKADDRMLCIAGEHDALVPPEYAVLPGAQHRTFPVGHLRMVSDPRVAKLCGEWLDGSDEMAEAA